MEENAQNRRQWLAVSRRGAHGLHDSILAAGPQVSDRLKIDGDEILAVETTVPNWFKRTRALHSAADWVMWTLVALTFIVGFIAVDWQLAWNMRPYAYGAGAAWYTLMT